jgi:hypothetical protein
MLRVSRVLLFVLCSRAAWSRGAVLQNCLQTACKPPANRLQTAVNLEANF